MNAWVDLSPFICSHHPDLFRQNVNELSPLPASYQVLSVNWRKTLTDESTGTCKWRVNGQHRIITTWITRIGYFPTGFQLSFCIIYWHPTFWLPCIPLLSKAKRIIENVWPSLCDKWICMDCGAVKCTSLNLYFPIVLPSRLHFWRMALLFSSNMIVLYR